MSAGRSKQIARQHSRPKPRDGLLVALVQRQRLAAVVPLVLDILQDDPLASAGRFRGDLLRGLMEVPSRFWARHAQLYERYRAALRAGAVARRQLPLEDRLQFWGPLVTTAGSREEHPQSRGADDAE